MTLVDGCEDGYYKDSIGEYQRAAADMRQWHGPVARLIAPENRRKWRTQGQASFGFYLDMYLNPPGHRYYFPPLTFAGSDGGWARAFGAVTVPDNADKLVILLKAENQLSDTDVCWFDGVGLYRMEAVR